MQFLVNPNLSISRCFDYDHAGRLLRMYHKVNDQPEILLSSNEYNELGQLIDKKLHSTDNVTTFKQSVDYRYNIRGWLTRINNSDLTPDDQNEPKNFFGVEMAYNNVFNGINNTPKYNGDIGAVKWSNNLGFDPGLKERAYKFEQDPLSRLLHADHLEKGTKLLL